MKWWDIKKRDVDLERELRADLELEEEEQRERGLTPEEARRAALRSFGNTTLIKEQTHEAWGWTPVEHLASGSSLCSAATRAVSWVYRCRYPHVSDRNRHYGSDVQFGECCPASAIAVS